MRLLTFSILISSRRQCCYVNIYKCIKLRTCLFSRNAKDPSMFPLFKIQATLLLLGDSQQIIQDTTKDQSKKNIRKQLFQMGVCGYSFVLFKTGQLGFINTHCSLRRINHVTGRYCCLSRLSIHEWSLAASATLRHSWTCVSFKTSAKERFLKLRLPTSTSVPEDISNEKCVTSHLVLQGSLVAPILHRHLHR